MTLSLYVLRHAKAEEAASGGDHGRALKGRGRKAAQLVGAALARLDQAPELVLASTATRARATAELALAAGAFEAPLELHDDIYNASAERLLLRIRTLASDARRVLLVGHQPALSLLIAELSGGEPEFPTGALARIDFELESWSEVATGTGRLVWLVTPEMIAALSARK